MNEAVKVPVLMVYMISNADSMQNNMNSDANISSGTGMNPAMAQMDMDTLKQMVAAGMMTKEQILEIKDQMIEQYGDEMSAMIVDQMAVMFVKSEYPNLPKLLYIGC